MRRNSLIRRTRALRLSRSARCGYSLLELLAVAAVLGILALAGVANFRPQTFGNMGAKVDARRLALDLGRARRRAIALGDNHFLAFRTVGPQATYEIRQRLSSGGTALVDSVRAFPNNVAVTVTPSLPEFNFEGHALAPYSITLTGPNRRWRVTVAQATGSVSVREL